MTKDELLHVYNTMSFGKDPVKEVLSVDDETIYIVSFNGPDLIFKFKSINEWSLQTVRELIVSTRDERLDLKSWKKGKTNESRNNQSGIDDRENMDSTTQS